MDPEIASKAIAVDSIVANISGMSVGDTFLDRVGTATAVSTSITATALDDETEITLLSPKPTRR